MKTSLKVCISLAILTFLTGCSGGLADVAQNILYPFENVNKQYKVPEQAPDDLKTVTFDLPADNGTPMSVHGWAYTAPNSEARVFVYLHGNGENLQALYEFGFLQALKNMGVHFIAIDYPGLGRSTGHPNQENLVNSAIAAIEWAKSNYPRSPLILWGRSLGAAVAMQAARKKEQDIQGLVLTSGWNNFFEAAKALSSLAKSIPKEWLEKNSYDSADAATNLRVITLMHHGTADKLIPFRLGQLLFNSFPRGNAFLRELPGKGHNDVFGDAQLWQDINGFVR